MSRCVVALLFWLLAAIAHAQPDSNDSYARIVTNSAALRAGPGPGFRILQVARRDDTFRVQGRASAGYWLELELAGGGSAYVQGDAVWLFDTSEQPVARQSWGIFAPPPLLRARGELAFSFGALRGNGFLAVRPSYLLAPSFGFEANLGASVGSLGRLFLIGAGAIVNLFPSWPVVPFVVAGGGTVRAAPNSDAFIFESGGRSMLYGGGGLRFGFKHRLIVRVEARGYAFFDADRRIAQQEISGGLSAFF
ncbi:MAG TPA: hypothetical protein VFX59_31885 [Polyangiales bacterium]|nr:hypothetical protein [Polyangiales bacterium]